VADLPIAASAKAGGRVRVEREKPIIAGEVSRFNQRLPCPPSSHDICFGLRDDLLPPGVAAKHALAQTDGIATEVSVFHETEYHVGNTETPRATKGDVRRRPTRPASRAAVVVFGCHADTLAQNRQFVMPRRNISLFRILRISRVFRAPGQTSRGGVSAERRHFCFLPSQFPICPRFPISLAVKIWPAKLIACAKP